MRIENKAYRTIWFEDNLVKIIDQTKLPHKFIIKNLKTVRDAINAIKTMEVRGAPLIGATAAYGLVLSIIEKNDLSFLKKHCLYIFFSFENDANYYHKQNKAFNDLLLQYFFH